MRLSCCLLLAALAAPASADFSDWAAVVVAGDSYAENGKDSEVFDNGRAAIAGELARLGFRPSNVRQFTDWPEKHRGVERSTPGRIASGLRDVARTARSGCLLYFTSHGSEEGIAVGDRTLAPRRLKRMVETSCGERPTVIVVSACYSGVFVPFLKAPNRFVLTAAAADRSSFGCGETDKFTYFDTCTVANLPNAGDFVTFASRTIACVAAREKQEQVERPSNPQLAVGANASAFPHWKAH